MFICHNGEDFIGWQFLLSKLFFYTNKLFLDAKSLFDRMSLVGFQNCFLPFSIIK